MKQTQTNQLTVRRQVALGLMLATAVATAAIAADVPTRIESAKTSLTATVVAIDQTTREVTLKSSLGNIVTFIAGPEVKRLNEVQVGDTVTATYYVSIAAELREPTAEEKEKPLTVLETEIRPPTDTPAGAEVRRIKAVVTVEAVDGTTQTITVKGPRGRYVTARVEQPSVLQKMQIGKTIVLTYTEAIAISVDK